MESKPIEWEKMKANTVYIDALPSKPIDKNFTFTEKFTKRNEYKEWKKRQDLISRNPDSVVLIRMEMSNGNFREFEIPTQNNSFVFNEKRYILEEEKKYYIIERKMYAYDYCEFLSLPIRKKIQLNEETNQLISQIEKDFYKPQKPRVSSNEIRELIRNSPQFSDTENSINPYLLKQFTDGEIIKQALQGAMLGKIFKVMFVIIIIIGILSLVSFFIDMYHSGIFDAVKKSLNG